MLSSPQSFERMIILTLLYLIYHDFYQRTAIWLKTLQVRPNLKRRVLKYNKSIEIYSKQKSKNKEEV